MKRALKRRPVAGLKPLAREEIASQPPKPLERQTLIMEAPTWHVQGELSKQMEARRNRIQRCLDFYYDRPLVNHEDSPWSMMHHMIAWGIDSTIMAQGKNDEKPKPVSTIGWLCGNGVCDGHKLLFVEDGHVRARVGPGVQGHEGQFLAMLAQTRVSRNQRIVVDGHEFTAEDLIREEQRRCLPRTELTFKLIGLSHYLPIDAEWKKQKWAALGSHSACSRRASPTDQWHDVRRHASADGLYLLAGPAPDGWRRDHGTVGPGAGGRRAASESGIPHAEPRWQLQQ